MIKIIQYKICYKYEDFPLSVSSIGTKICKSDGVTSFGEEEIKTFERT